MTAIVLIIIGILCFIATALIFVAIAHGVFFLFRARLFLTLLLMGLRRSRERDKNIELRKEGKV